MGLHSFLLGETYGLHGTLLRHTWCVKGKTVRGTWTEWTQQIIVCHFVQKCHVWTQIGCFYCKSQCILIEDTDVI